jgi:hypothetical protein
LAKALTSTAIAVVSTWGLAEVTWTLLFDYFIFPAMKVGYIFPEYRYAVFEAVALAWSIAGMWAAGLMLNSAIRNMSVPKSGALALGWFLTLSFVLLAGVVFGLLWREWEIRHPTVVSFPHGQAEVGSFRDRVSLLQCPHQG